MSLASNLLYRTLGHLSPSDIDAKKVIVIAIQCIGHADLTVKVFVDKRGKLFVGRYKKKPRDWYHAKLKLKQEQRTQKMVENSS